MLNGERRIVVLPGHGLECGKCGGSLPDVNRTTTSNGFVLRERRCPQCGELNATTERVIATRAVRSRRITIDRSEYL